ncbi:hypothetical protein [Aeromonas phage 13AhydR10PP]|nr:hypothetical protein [Aeromonas phage 13AhydR10PP]
MQVKRPQKTAVIATNIRTGKQHLYQSMQQAADEGGFSYQYVVQCVRGLITQHAGFTFAPVSGLRPVEKPNPRLYPIADLRNQGMTNKQIATETGLKLDTVQKYAKQAARLGLTTHINKAA